MNNAPSAGSRRQLWLKVIVLGLLGWAIVYGITHDHAHMDSPGGGEPGTEDRGEDP